MTMNKFICLLQDLNEVREYMRQNKIKHMPFIKIAHNGKYKYVCEILNPENLESILIGLHGKISLPKEGEKYYKPGSINLYETVANILKK